jgi:GT2 family glycosyltransferase
MLRKVVSEPQKPSISVILATKGNKTILLEKCVRSLQRQTFQEFEVILIYSTFPKQLVGLFETCNVITLKENSSTLGAARNLGVKHAKSDLIAFIDDDCEAPENWLDQIISTFQQYPSLSCLGGPHLTPKEEYENNPLLFAQGSFMESHLKGNYSDCSAIGKIAGCNVAYRKSAFNKVGYLNETLKSGEDWEFHRRLVENGYNLRFDSRIFVYHHRQGLKHAFWNSSKMVPFFLSIKTLRYARYESLFATFYLTNLLCVLLLITLLLSPFAFFIFLLSILLGHFIFTAIRTKNYSWRIIYYPLELSFTFARLAGFYFGIIKTLFQLLARTHVK